ncbi:MAG: hypothetical protein SOI66_00015 [Bifidobacterium sp.]|jgi:hypothetical protein
MNDPGPFDDLLLLLALLPLPLFALVALPVLLPACMGRLLGAGPAAWTLLLA